MTVFFYVIINLFHNKNNKKMLSTKYFTAIFFDKEKKPYKYRNIKNDSRSMESFAKFAITKNAVEINFYCSVTRNFSHKVFF